MGFLLSIWYILWLHWSIVCSLLDWSGTWKSRFRETLYRTGTIGDTSGSGFPSYHHLWQQDRSWLASFGCLFICDGVVRSSALHLWYGAILSDVYGLVTSGLEQAFVVVVILLHGGSLVVISISHFLCTGISFGHDRILFLLHGIIGAGQYPVFTAFLSSASIYWDCSLVLD
jgi:hypothetical protein